MFADSADDLHFVLLNGNRGNFCLSLSEQTESDNVRSQCWSSDVDHYIQVQGDFTEVRRWDQPGTARRFANELVARELGRFHSLLESEQPLRELSVVARMMRIFRSMRSALGPGVDGVGSLEAFLCFLACSSENAEISSLDLAKWNLSYSARETALQVNRDTWRVLQGDAVSADGRLGLKTYFDLVLRHASGQLFQEAHYQAVFSSQLMLGGFAPLPIRPVHSSAFKGLHFTPPSLARSVVEESLAAFTASRDMGKRLVTVFDPACGSGEFLREAFRLLKLRRHDGPIRLIGWDISPAACSTSRFVLGWEAIGFPHPVSVEIALEDSLSRSRWPEQIDLLLMNPPFVSWEDMGPEERSTVAETLGSVGKNRPDMASAFLRKAAYCLSETSVLGTVLPASILSSKTSRGLRSELSDLLSLRIVARLGSQQLFSNAIVDPAFVVGVKGTRRQVGEIALWADHRPDSSSASLRALRRVRNVESLGETLVDGDGFSIYTQPTLGLTGDDWVPRRYRSWKLFEQTKHLPRVKDFFHVRQGIRTGANEVFVLTKERYSALPAKERRYFRPAVVNSSIRRNVLSMGSYVFYPYGRFTIAEEIELQLRVPNYFASTLLPAKGLLLKRAGIDRSRWWELTRHRDWQIEEEPKLVSTYFGDRGSFAIDEEGNSVVLQGYAWFPKASDSRSSDIWQGFSAACLGLLASSTMDDLLAAVSNHVGGGQWDLSTRFVDRLPLPDLLSDSVSADVFSGLVDLGYRISRGLEVSRKLIDDLALAAYGLSGL
jgi:hypothetical protein